MSLVLATIASVRQYRLHKQHKADLARLDTYEAAFANLDLNSAALSFPPELAHLQQQAHAAAAACPTCGRANASRCHQRKCHRHRHRGRCGRNRAARDAAEVAAISAIQVPAVVESESGSGWGRHADSKGPDFTIAAASPAGEKEMLAPYDDDRYLQVPAEVAQPPYRN